MPDSRFSRQYARPPSEASFVLRLQAGAVRVLPTGRQSGPYEMGATANRPSPGPPVRRSASSRTSRGAAAAESTGKASPPRPATSARSTGPRSVARPAPVGTRIGVISDNHGYLDPAILDIFAGVKHIIHAGDIGDPKILTALRRIAPVTAVGGNMDSGTLAAKLPREVAGQVAGVRFVVGHKRKRLLKRLDAGKIEGAAPDLVVWGHEHVPTAAWVEGVLFLNPGTASAPDEEDDGPTVAIVSVKPAGLAVCFVPLSPRARDAASAT